MCFRKESIHATEIGRESKVSGIERQHSLNHHTPEVILDCGPGGPIVGSVTNEVEFSTYAFRKPKLSLAANGAHW